MKPQLYLWPRQNSQKKYPVAIRLTENRKSKFIFIGYAIKKEHWNKTSKSIRLSYENYEELDNLIKLKLKEIESILPVSNDMNNYKKLSFIQYFNNHIRNLETGKKIADRNKHAVVLAHIKEFLIKSHKTEELLFKDITGDLLQELVYFFEGLKLSKNTQNGYFKKIKHLYFLAIKNNVFTPLRNPFDTFENRTSKPQNNSLTINEFKGLELFNPYQYKDKELFSNSLIPEIASLRNIFVFQFYCYGIRVSDLLLLKWDNINNGKIVYIMRKTKKEKTILLNNSLLERLRFFLPIEKILLLLKQKDNILDIELLNSLPTDKKEMLLKYTKEKNLTLYERVIEKEKAFFSDTYYKETHIKYDTIKNICNGLATDESERNNFIIPLLNETDKAKLNTTNDDLTIYRIIQSNTTLYNRALKQLNKSFLDTDGQLIKTKLTSHLPRHTFTSISLSLGLDLFTISQSLGHSDIRTTQNYIHTLDNELVDKNIGDIFNKFGTANEKIITENKKIKIYASKSVKKIE